MTRKNITNFIAKTRRFGLFLPLSNVILCYGDRILSEGMKHRIAERRHRLIKRHISEICKETLNREYEDMPTRPEGWVGNIWVMWLQGEAQMPDLVQTCYRSICKNSAGHPVVLLTAENVKDYITLPEYIWKKYREGKISHAHFSDIVRMKLLAEHGGFWIDATIYLARPIPQEVFEYPYYTIKQKPFGENISKCRWTGFFQWSIPNLSISNVVSDIFDEFWAKEDVIVDYFFIDHALNTAYEISTASCDLIDAVPFNSSSTYELVSKLNYRYQHDDYQKIMQDTFAFKLDWKRYTANQLNALCDTYYQYIKECVKSR